MGGRHLLRRRGADGSARRLPRAPLARRVRVREGRGPARRPAHDRRRGRPALARGATAARRDAHRARPRPRARRSATSSSSRAATSSRSASSGSSPPGSSTRRSASSRDAEGHGLAARARSGSASRSLVAAAEYVLRARRTLAEPRWRARRAGRERARRPRPRAEALNLRLTPRNRVLLYSGDHTRKGDDVEPLPDLPTLTDDELRAMIRELEKEEDEISFRRRVLHGRIDILRAELVARLREQVSAGEAQLADVERLSEILAAKAASSGGRRRVNHVYCPECGFQNPEAANYCPRCGALLQADDRRRDDDELRPRDEVRRGRCSAAGSVARWPRARRPLRRRHGRPDVPARPGQDADRPLARVRDLPRRRHRLAPPRRARA